MARAEPERIVITGATAGIGRELALQYSAPGVVLGLTGRRVELLEQVALACRARGAEVLTWAVDVTDGPAMRALAEAYLARAGCVDLVIANAGVGCQDRLEQGDPAPLTHLIDVNVNGALNTLVPFVPAMKARGRGQLVGIASVAGFRPFTEHATYCASKRCLRDLLEGYSHELRRWGITVTTINPGFVVSEMTARNRFHMPFLLETDEACRRIRRAIARGDRVHTFPLPMRVIAYLLQALPLWAVRPIVSRRS